MEQCNIKFNEDSIGKLLFKFAVPSIISLLVIELYNMVDMVFTGRYIGENAIAALTIAFPIQKFIVSEGMLVAVGAATIVASELGSRNNKKLISTIVNAFILMTVILIFSLSVVYLFKNNILSALGASRKIYPLADKYISIVLIGCSFQCISMAACYIMNSFGYTKVTLKSNILGLCINVIMNYILVAKAGFGIQGAAIATDLSQLIALIYVFYKFKKVKLKFRIKCLDIDILKKILTIGFTSFVIEISDAVISVILNELLIAKGGDNAIIIVGIITKVSMLLYVTIIGISGSMQPIVAYNYGSGNYRKMKEILRLTIKVVVVTSVISGSILMLLANSIAAFFLKDASLVGETAVAIRISILAYPIMGIYYVCIYYYQAINEAAKAFMLTVYGNIIVFMLTVLLMVNLFGIIGAWTAYPVSELISFATAVWYIRKAITDNSQKAALCSKHKEKYSYMKV